MLASVSYRQLIPVRGTDYRTDVIDIELPDGSTTYTMDVLGQLGSYASSITFLNRSNNVVHFLSRPDSVGFSIPKQTSWTRTDAWLRWFSLTAADAAGFAANSDLSLTIAPANEVRV